MKKKTILSIIIGILIIGLLIYAIVEKSPGNSIDQGDGVEEYSAGENNTSNDSESKEGNGSQNEQNNIFTADESEAIKISTPHIHVKTVEAKAGDSRVAVNVSIHNNPGILGMTLSVMYDDSVLTLTEASNGDATSALTMTEPGKYVSQCRFVWDGQSISEEEIKDGDILTLYFDVSDAAPNGSYPITVFCNDGDIVDNELEPVPITILNGAITVTQ